MRRTGRRLLLAPTWIMTTGFVGFVFFWWWCERLLRFCGGSSVAVFTVRQDLFFLSVLAVLYGVLRTKAHPLYNAGYARWLALTPWAWPAPLPLGPAALVWRDLLVLGPMALLAKFAAHGSPWGPLVAFSVAYLVPVAGALLGTGAGQAAFGIVFGLAAVVRLWPSYGSVVPVLAALHVLAFVGVRQSLRAFPWRNHAGAAAALRLNLKPEPVTGGFLDRLGPVEPPPARAPAAGLAAGLLIGWWVYCVTAQCARHGDATPALAFVAMLARGAAMIRLAVYSDGHVWPAGPVGRLAGGRWLIPAYDQVFVGPLCTAAVGSLGALAGWRLAAAGYVTVAAAAGVVSAAAVVVVIDTGPSLRRWKLTGGHRIVPRPAERNGANSRTRRQRNSSF